MEKINVIGLKMQIQNPSKEIDMGTLGGNKERKWTTK